MYTESTYTCTPHSRASQTHGTTYTEQNPGYEARQDSKWRSFQSLSVLYDSKQASWVYQVQDSCTIWSRSTSCKTTNQLPRFPLVQAPIIPVEMCVYHGTRLVLGSQLHMHEGYTDPSNVSQTVVWKHCQQPTFDTAWGSAPDFKSRDTISRCPYWHARCKGVKPFCT